MSASPRRGASTLRCLRRRGQIDQLDGVRALAVVAVMTFHDFVTGWGYLGVDVFFVLSGFIITTVLWKRPGSGALTSRWRDFLWRRALRLYPALLGLVVVGTALAVTVPGVPDSRSDVVVHGLLALTQVSALWQGLGLELLHPFAQAWSLADEWYFYAVWPVVVLACADRQLTARVLLRASAAAAAVLYLVSLPTPAAWFYSGPTSRMAEILVGAAVAFWMLDASPTRRPVPSWAAGLGVLLLGAYMVLGPQESEPAFRWVGAPLAVVVTIVLIRHGYEHRDGAVTRALGARPAAWLGERSYSLYLWNLVPIYLLDKDVVSLPLPVLGVLGVGAAMAATVLSFRYLEQPFMHSRGAALRPAGPVVVPAAELPQAAT